MWCKNFYFPLFFQFNFDGKKAGKFLQRPKIQGKTDLCQQLAGEKINVAFLKTLRDATGIPIVNIIQRRKANSEGSADPPPKRPRLSEIQISQLPAASPQSPPVDVKKYYVGKWIISTWVLINVNTILVESRWLWWKKWNWKTHQVVVLIFICNYNYAFFTQD